MTELAFDQLPPDMQARAAVASSDVPQFTDYFAAGDREWVSLPDGVQQVEIKVLSEGDRKKYLNSTNQEFTMNARTRDLKMKSNLGEERAALLRIAVTDWSVLRGGQPLPFNGRNLDAALDSWPPAVIDTVVDAINRLNPWLRGDDDLEALEAERADLDKRIEDAKAKLGK